MCWTFRRLAKERKKKHLNMEKVNMVTKKIVILKANPHYTNSNGLHDGMVNN